MSLRERQKEQRRLAIIRAAQRWMRTHNTVPDLNMDAIAEEAGVSKPTVYQNFKSENDLVAEVMRLGMEALEQYLYTLQSSSPTEQLVQIYRMLLDEKYSPDGLLTGLEPVQILSVMRSHPEIRAAKERTSFCIRQLIEKGKAAGEIRQDILAERLVSWMFCSLNVLKATYPDKDDTYWRAHLHMHIDEMVTDLLHLISPK
jgi:AcrR family transcriptional regulator